MPEASEKPMTLFHFLHLHPYGPNKEEEKEKGLTVDAFQYEEIVPTTSSLHYAECRFLVIQRIHSLIFLLDILHPHHLSNRPQSTFTVLHLSVVTC